MPDIFEGLNDAQREAVETVRGPVAILAGAGSGKTTTITRRIANQVQTETFLPREILAVTFTAKAAREMADRLVPLGVTGIRVKTFHAEALAQFRRFSEDQPQIVANKGQILHSIAQRLPKPHRFTALRDIAGEIEWAKNQRIGARDYLAKLGAHEPPLPAELMHQVYVSYEVKKRKVGLIDFEDLLERTATILGEDERALSVVRGRYAAFTVDEYQDVNRLQQALLDAWLGVRDEVCVVGDDYQSIFGFTGASPNYLLGFPDRFEHACVVTLTENYRSTPEVLAVANKLVPGLGGSRKVIRSTLAAGPSPRIRDFETGAREVAFVVSEAKRLNEQGVAWEQIAVLFRINGRTEDFEEAFARAHVPFQVRDGSFLARPGARAFLGRARGWPAGSSVAAAVQSIVEQLGYDPAGKYGDGEEATRQADLEKLVALAKEFPGEDLAAFEADLRARFETDNEGRGVQLMTYHRSKGLEFEAVFLPRLEEKELPFALSKGQHDIAEERRLFYVGITRAKRYLTISYAHSRDGERRTRPRRSPFLEELKPSQASKAAPRRAPEISRRAPVGMDGASLEDQLARTPVLLALKEWRKGVAAEAGLPAYVVFHDATLGKIAAAMPTIPADLRQISGVGPLKMQRYGEQILAILSTFPANEVAVTASG